jgi:hypothetical protein
MESQLRFARRSRALLQAAAGDFLLREQLVTDPAGVLFEYVKGEAPPPETAAAANHLLYALVSSPVTLEWMKRLRAKPRKTPPSDRELARELAGVLTHRSDRAVVSALMRFGTTSSARIEPAFDLLRSMLAGLERGGESGTEFTPGTGGTEFTPGTGGTEFTPGTGGTESTPGTGGTEFTPGTGTGGTEFTPGTGTGTGTEATPGTGTGTGTEATPGTGTGTGTEATPGTGTGTEATPGTGTGTEASLGSILRGGWGEFEATMIALVEYAVTLRNAGVLFEIGFD